MAPHWSGPLVAQIDFWKHYYYYNWNTEHCRDLNLRNADDAYLCRIGGISICVYAMLFLRDHLTI